MLGLWLGRRASSVLIQVLLRKVWAGHQRGTRHRLAGALLLPLLRHFPRHKDCVDGKESRYETWTAMLRRTAASGCGGRRMTALDAEAP